MSTDNKKILMLNSNSNLETKDVNSWECVAEKSVGSFIQGIETSKGEGGEDAKGKFRSWNGFSENWLIEPFCRSGGTDGGEPSAY